MADVELAHRSSDKATRRAAAATTRGGKGFYSSIASAAKDEEEDSLTTTIATDDDVESFGNNIDATAALNINSSGANNSLDNGATTYSTRLYQKQPRRTFRVTAPSDLPGGYRLNVIFLDKQPITSTAGPIFQDKEVVVQVPAEGVEAGQVWDALECEPLMGEWSDGLFDCCSDENQTKRNTTCEILSAWFCNLILWARILQSLGYNAFGYRRRPRIMNEQQQEIQDECPPSSPNNGHNSDHDNPDIDYHPTHSYYSSNLVWIVAALFLVFHVVPFPPLQVVLLLYFLYITTMARWAVRKQYGIPGNVCCDCFTTATCCSCCYLLQAHRHMQQNGHTPFRCAACDAAPDRRRRVLATQIV